MSPPITDTRPLLMIVPSRGRPEAVARVSAAWDMTGAWQSAELLFVIDVDDPKFAVYERELGARSIGYRSIPKWQPLVPKLDSAAIDHARYYPDQRFIGFAGDDHLPRTAGWAQDYIGALEGLGTGIIYPDDGHKGERLASSWAMTANIIRALGRMVPAPVEHLYCDNSIMDLGRAVGCLRYLPHLLVEHMNPFNDGKAPMDEQYARVNGNDQYRKDRPAYKKWRSGGGLQRDVRAVAELLGGNVQWQTS